MLPLLTAQGDWESRGSGACSLQRMLGAGFVRKIVTECLESALNDAYQGFRFPVPEEATFTDLGSSLHSRTILPRWTLIQVWSGRNTAHSGCPSVVMNE